MRHQHVNIEAGGMGFSAAGAVRGPAALPGGAPDPTVSDQRPAEQGVPHQHIQVQVLHGHLGPDQNPLENIGDATHH